MMQRLQTAVLKTYLDCDNEKNSISKSLVRDQPANSVRSDVSYKIQIE